MGAEPTTAPAPEVTAVTLPATPAPVRAPAPGSDPRQYGPAPMPFTAAPAAHTTPPSGIPGQFQPPADAVPASAPQAAARPAPKRRRPLLPALTALVVIAAVATAAVLVAKHHGGGKPAATTSPSRHSPTATGSVAPATAASGIPVGMVGTWKTSFSSSLGDNLRELTVHQDGTVQLNGDSSSYTCTWTMRVTSAGPPVTLSASKLVSGSPAGSCRPGPPTTLTLVDPTHLRRDNLDANRAPLTYEKTG